MKHTTWSGLLLAAAITGAPALASAAPGSVVFGAPKKQTVFGELGYSGIPRIGYLHPLSPRFALGGEFILDIGQFYGLSDGIPGTVTVAGGVPLRLVISESKDLIVGLGFTPGLGVSIREFGFGPFSTSTTLFALLLHSELNVGYKVNQQVTVGGGVELPMTLYAGDFTQFVIPIVFGPQVEFALTPEWSLSGDLKMGPHISAGDFSNTSFGFKFQVGVAYAF